MGEGWSHFQRQQESFIFFTLPCPMPPGGPLKYSLEGHQFAIFAMKLTSDKRYIVSVSNKFITFDVVTSDLARQVYPKVQNITHAINFLKNSLALQVFSRNSATRDIFFHVSGSSFSLLDFILFRHY
jgi:hypothetical protein